MKIAKLLFYTFLCLNIYTTSAQQAKKREIGFVSDNDLYVSFFLDQYYTNGLAIYYKEAFDTQFLNFSKRIQNITLGQNIYNPYRNNVPSLFYQDRPYAGYAYLNFSEQFSNTETLLTFGISLNGIGKKTGAEEAQNFIHHFYDIDPSNGWKHQVKEKYGFGIFANYTRLLPIISDDRFRIATYHKLNLNRIFSNISSGIAIKFNRSTNKTTNLNNTTFFDTALQTQKNTWVRESYWGLKSHITYQFSDATVTGVLENNNIGKTFGLQPMIWHNTIGYYWNLENWNFSYQYHIHTKNVQQISNKWIRYGNILVAYKF